MTVQNVATVTLSDYEEEFRIFKNNIGAVTRAFYYDAAYWEQIKANSKVVCTLNETPWLWNDFRLIASSYVFIILGCIFDSYDSTFRLSRLIQTAKSSGYFKKENLRLRKMAQPDIVPEWIDAYMRNTHEMTGEDFRTLKAYVNSISTDWEKIRDVRNKIVAHQERFPDKLSKKHLLAAADRKQIENIIRRLLIVEHILQEAGLNGTKPDYNHRSHQMKDIAQKELKRTVDLLSSGVKYMMEHKNT